MPIRPAPIAAAVLVAALPGAAQAEAVQTNTATAQVLDTIQFAVLLDMNFGHVALRDNANGGVVLIDPSSTGRSCDTALVCAGSFAPSQLELTGSDADVQVTFDPTFQLTGPGAPILAEPQFPGGSGTVVRISGGSTVVKLGARLNINPNQAPGVYTGQFSVNLEYY
ncbi:DUF4402 domain-containing protein [Novosphingobium sp. B 225]|uniref:DUF4402 domain-containing protein n=1 Tax=Novosphingobium sp. B 225 TaxID=1961849 RepID=UPI0015963197|nr:DUF4402 domain-containing protein [Novosphingobium sp. B 225]